MKEVTSDFLNLYKPFLETEKCNKKWFCFAVLILLIPFVYSAVSLIYGFSYLTINYIVALVVIGFLLYDLTIWLCFSHEKKRTCKLFFENIYKNKILILLIAFLCWIMLGTFFSTDFKLSLIGYNETQRSIGLLQYLSIAVFFIVFYNIKPNKTRLVLLRLFVIISTIIVIMTFIDPNNTFMPGFGRNSYKWSAMFINPNHAGYYMCMAILASAMLMREDKNWISIITLSISFVLISTYLFLNGSMGPELAIICALLVMFVFYSIKDKKIEWKIPLMIVSILIIACLVQFLYFKSSSGGFINEISMSTKGGDISSGRLAMWKLCIENMAQRPLFGTGLATYNQYNAGKTAFARPHNEFLEYGAQNGVIALGLYVTVIFEICRNGFKNCKKLDSSTIVACGAVVAYLISSFFGNQMPHIYPVYMMMLAFAVSGTNNIKEVDK